MNPLFKVTVGCLLIIGGVVWILNTMLEMLVNLIQVIG